MTTQLAAPSGCAPVPAVLALIWFLSFLGPLSLVIPFIMFHFLLVVVYHRRYAAAFLLLLGTPLSVPFLMGIYDYGSGTALLRGCGLPGTTFHNLDHMMRCGRVSYGCFVSGNEWISLLPYNGAVYLLTKCLGPMPGAYTGPYPTEREAKDALADATRIAPHDLEKDRITIAGIAIDLDAGVGLELLQRIRRFDGSSYESGCEIKATIWQEECVLLRIPNRPAWTSSDTPSAAIVLISRKAGRPFAYYPEGDYYHHSSPVPWKRPEP